MSNFEELQAQAIQARESQLKADRKYFQEETEKFERTLEVGKYLANILRHRGILPDFEFLYSETRENQPLMGGLLRNKIIERRFDNKNITMGKGWNICHSSESEETEHSHYTTKWIKSRNVIISEQGIICLINDNTARAQSKLIGGVTYNLDGTVDRSGTQDLLDLQIDQNNNRNDMPFITRGILDFSIRNNINLAGY